MRRDPKPYRPYAQGGQKLRELRKTAGLTQDALAVLMAGDPEDWSRIIAERTKLSRWENGHHRPLPDSRARLAHALGVPVERIDELWEAGGDPFRRGDWVAFLAAVDPERMQRLVEWGEDEMAYRAANPREAKVA